MSLEAQQLAVCRKYAVLPFPTASSLVIGISQNVFEGVLPLNGLRHLPEANSTGWYLWAGEEFLHDENFFSPVHLFHLSTLLPTIVKYLLLPPGWRFLITPPDYEDVWYDDTLL